MNLEFDSGCVKCDEALRRMVLHIKSASDFQSFHTGMLILLSEKKVSEEKTIEWLLRVLYAHEKSKEHTFGARFENLLDRVGKESMLKWLVTMEEKYPSQEKSNV